MKKIGVLASMLIFLLVACLITPMISISAESSTPQTGSADSDGWIMGDVDNDKTVTIIDATCIQRILAGITKDPDEGMFIRGRVTGEEVLNIIDATMIQRFLAGLPYDGQINVPVVLPDKPTEEPTLGPTQAPTSVPTEAPTQTITKPSFVIESVNANAGDKNVAVNVSVVNNPGIAAIALDIIYDKTELELKDFTYNTPALQGASTTPYNSAAKTPRLFMVNGTKNITGDFTFATLYFDVLASASGSCAISVAYDEDNVYNLAEENISFDVISGAIIVAGEQGTEKPETDQFTVVFKDFDGRVLSTHKVNKGESAEAPDNPSRDGYIFSQWDIAFDNVQSDLVVTAVYEQSSTSPCFIIDKVKAKPGDKNVAVTVAVKNNPGIAAIALDILYNNSQLTLTNFTYNSTALQGASTTPYNAAASVYRLLMVNGTENITGDFVFATLYFDVSNQAAGTIPITAVYDEDNVYDITEENIAFDVINGSVTIA